MVNLELKDDKLILGKLTLRENQTCNNLNTVLTYRFLMTEWTLVQTTSAAGTHLQIKIWEASVEHLKAKINLENMMGYTYHMSIRTLK